MKIFYKWSMPLLTHNFSCKKCGGHEALSSTTIIKKCDVKTSSDRQDCYILKTNLELTYLGVIQMDASNNNKNVNKIL